MNNKLLLINTITLLYRSSLIDNRMERPVQLLLDVCGLVKGAESDLTIDKETKMLAELKNLALEMVYAPDNVEYDFTELLQKVQIITIPDPLLFDAFKENLLYEMSQEELRKSCIRIQSNFQKHFKENEVKSILGRYASKAKFKSDEIRDVGKFIQEMMSELEPFQNLDKAEEDKALVASVDFNNLDSVTEAFNKVKESRSDAGMLKTGWQAVNKMLDGGFRLGEFVNVAALQHKNKSGFTRNLFKHFCLYNEPTLINENKKPLLLYITLEDEIDTVVEWLYKSLKENEENVEITKDIVLNTPAEEMAAYMTKQLRRNGWYIGLHRFNPSEWTYLDLQNTILRYEADGFEVKAIVCDYLSLIPTKGCTQGPHGVDLRDLFRRIRNFVSARKTLFITPHQLSTDAKMLQRQDALDFVQRVNGGGYYSGSKQIDQEIDVELILHIEEVDGRSYQTIQRGKRRGVDITPLGDRYTVLPFQDIGGLRDDLLGLDSSVKKPGQVSQAVKAVSDVDDAFWL